jgi:hypothetical protein
MDQGVAQAALVAATLKQRVRRVPCSVPQIFHPPPPPRKFVSPPLDELLSHRIWIELTATLHQAERPLSSLSLRRSRLDWRAFV